MPIDPSIPLQSRSPIQAPNLIEQYGQVLALKGAQQNQALHAEQLKHAQLANREAELAARDQQAVQSILGETGGDINKALPRLAGAVTPKTFMAIQKAHLETRKTLGEIADKDLVVQKYKNDQLAGLTGQALQMPDDQYAANWAQIRQAALQIEPNLPIPEQPIPKEQLSAYRLGFMTQDSYLKEESDKRAKAAEVRAQSGEQRAQQKFTAEMPGVVADANLKQLTAQGQAPIQPAEQARLSADSKRDAEMTAYRRATLAETKRGHDLSYNATMATGGRQAAAQTAGNESKLRDDYRSDAKDFSKVRDAYGRIIESSKSQTGPGDISLIYGYMRILDPGSTVREGEFATAQNAGSIPDNIRAAYNKAVSGQRLSPDIRNQFVSEAKTIYSRAEQDYNKMRQWYSDTASRSGMNPDNVLVDYSSSVKPEKPAAPKMGTVEDGYVFLGGNPADQSRWKKR